MPQAVLSLFYITLLPTDKDLLTNNINYRYKLLKDEFPLVPVHYIHKTLNGERTLFKAYKVIEEQLHNYNEATSGFRKINKPRPSGSHEANLSPDSVIMQIDSNRNPTTLAVGYAMVFELRAARKKREEEHGMLSLPTFLKP